MGLSQWPSKFAEADRDADNVIVVGPFTIIKLTAKAALLETRRGAQVWVGRSAMKKIKKPLKEQLRFDSFETFPFVARDIERSLEGQRLRDHD